MKNNKYCSSSRIRTPWDDKDCLSNFELFIRNEYQDHFYSKHLKLSESSETNLLNSISLTECRYCHSFNIKRRGYTSNGVQRYKCNDCNKSFSVTTNTIFENHKIPISEWIEFCLNIFNYSSIHLDSRNNKNAFTTSKYWLAKLFLLLKNYQDNIMLKGIVEIDETYYTVIQSKRVHTSDGNLPRGLSQNKYCIGIGCDKNNVYLKIEGKAKTSELKTINTFENHIAGDSVLIHDYEKAHKALVSKLGLKSKAYNTKYLKQFEDKNNPLRRVNHYCFLLKRFLNAHSGFNRDELQDYLNLFAFIMNPPNNKLEKVKILIEISLKSTERLTFRNYYSKKDD